MLSKVLTAGALMLALGLAACDDAEEAAVEPTVEENAGPVVVTPPAETTPAPVPGEQQGSLEEELEEEGAVALPENTAEQLEEEGVIVTDPPPAQNQ